MKLNSQQIAWIVDEFVRCERTYEELAIDTGLSVATIKRALSEAGELDLSWHKSAEQHAMLQHLRAKGITTLTQLQGKL